MGGEVDDLKSDPVPFGHDLLLFTYSYRGGITCVRYQRL